MRKIIIFEKRWENQMKQRFYFDTSVFGGVYDLEFEEATLQLFEGVKLEKIICVYSSLTETELVNAPKNVREYFKNLPKENKEKVKIDDEAIALASRYIEEKVVGKTSFDDCLHIATATLNKVDILVSWNFKHIVNVYRIRGYNSINLRMNYIPLEIRSPREILEYED
ncbi:MAG: PIN domain protein [Flavobacteriaceae bacterium]